MRLDKYLKVTGLIPRRTVAKEACDKGRVRLDGRPAKASSEVAEGHRIAFELGRRALEVEVLEVPQGNLAKADRGRCYRVLNERTSEGGPASAEQG